MFQLKRIGGEQRIVFNQQFQACGPDRGGHLLIESRPLRIRLPLAGKERFVEHGKADFYQDRICPHGLDFLHLQLHSLERRGIQQLRADVAVGVFQVRGRYTRISDAAPNIERGVEVGHICDQFTVKILKYGWNRRRLGAA